jgi:hypothetical protein
MSVFAANYFWKCSSFKYERFVVLIGKMSESKAWNRCEATKEVESKFIAPNESHNDITGPEEGRSKDK